METGVAPDRSLSIVSTEPHSIRKDTEVPQAVDLRQVARFAHFSPPSSDRAPRLGLSRTYPARYSLFNQGDVVEDVFYLEHGLVKLVQSHHDGRDERIIGLRADGWIVAAAAAVLDEPYVATVVTVVPCQIARIGAADFRSRLKFDPMLASAVHRMHAREIYDELARPSETSTSARSRFEHLLVDLASPAEAEESGEIRAHVPLRQWEIAQLIGVAPPYLCQLMAEMMADGTLRRECGAFVLTLRSGRPAPSQAAAAARRGMGMDGANVAHTERLQCPPLSSDCQ